MDILSSQKKKKRVLSKQQKNVNKCETEYLKPNKSNENGGNAEGISDISRRSDVALKLFRVRLSFEIDAIVIILTTVSFALRFYKLDEPKQIVFDELHYGKYVALYMRNTFFFDSHPPFGKQLIALAGYAAGFDGKYKFTQIGNAYDDTVPIFALRLIPAACGSLIVPLVYYIMSELRYSQCISALAATMILLENSLLTQSRFVLMEPIMIFFSLLGLYCTLRYCRMVSVKYRYPWLAAAFIFHALAICVKYTALYTWFLSVFLICQDFWNNVIGDKRISDIEIAKIAANRLVYTLGVSILVYTSVFYIHLSTLYKAGPHDSVMTSAFQASLEGGLASITKGQPLKIVHGSQITLRHTHGRACWLHSHAHLYPVRYSDERGSSHQQQVSCYSFKDVNNWWIVKKPEKNNLVVGEPADSIKHDDIIQLVHGITSRALNTHDVAAPMTPHSQEVSCYIDYNVSMPAQNLWRVEILNRNEQGTDVWLAIRSLVRLVHANSSHMLKFSGRQLPDWGFYQHEVVADKSQPSDDTVWNVEEHRHTKSEDEKERERDMVNAEMIPLRATSLTFLRKFTELQYKMISTNQQEKVENHMYSSEPIEWPLLSRGIAYWISPDHNGQIHLLGNVASWYSGMVAISIYCALLMFYTLRRRRLFHDIPEDIWEKFVKCGQILLLGYALNYLPYFFVDRTLFLHHYLPAVVFKIALIASLIEHVCSISRNNIRVRYFFSSVVVFWFVFVAYVFKEFLAFSYGFQAMSANDIIRLRWKESWDFIIHKK